MTLDKPTAAEALADINQSQKRSANLYAYAHAAPYLGLTGLLWLITDVVFQFVPAARDWIWPTASLVALPLFIAIAVSQSIRRPREPGSASLDAYFWRGMAIWGLTVAFVIGTIVIFAPRDGVAVHSFIGLFFGIAYAVAGLWMGKRLLGVGLAMAVLTMIGHFFVEAWYTLYMGLVGGGGMMLAALWMRRA